MSATLTGINLRRYSIPPCPQVVLEPKQFEIPTPGVRGVVLCRKPAVELQPSAQTCVQGMLEFSLETPRTALTAQVRATSNAVAPSATVRTRSPTADKMPGSKGYLGGVGEGAEKLKGSSTGGSKSEDRLKGEDAQLKAEKGGNVVARELAKQNLGEWEGVIWHDDDTGEAESLGTVSASLGTVEVASKHGDIPQAGSLPEPYDLLICLKGIGVIREVRSESRLKQNGRILH